MKRENFLGILRIFMGWIFLWPFLDKLIGLGFTTSPKNAWLNGGSPTTGFLSNATKGPLELFYKTLAGSTVVDWLFMLGLLSQSPFVLPCTLVHGLSGLWETEKNKPVTSSA